MEQKNVFKMILALCVTLIFVLFIFGWIPFDKGDSSETGFVVLGESENWQLEADEWGWSNLSYKGYVPDIEEKITVSGIIYTEDGELQINKSIDQYTVVDEIVSGHWLISEDLKYDKAELTIQWSDGQEVYEEVLKTE